MNLSGTVQQLLQQLSQTSELEWIAVTFGIAQVLLAWKNKVLLYPAGIISTACTIFLMAEAKLYAESVLNLYYLVMSVYGWVHWVRRRSEPELPVTRAGTGDLAITAVIVFAGFGILYFVLRQITDSDVPALDALVSCTAWAGMWLLARRKLENWILLNLSNLVAIPLLYYKGLLVYSLLTTVLFVVAIFGYFEWKQIMERKKAPAL